MDLVSRISDVITAIGTAIKGKQDNLISGSNIKTINNASILGSGNMTIVGSQNTFIQENEPNPSSGEKVFWIQTNQDGTIQFNIVEGI